MKHCIQCDQSLDSKQSFCQVCGTSVDEMKKGGSKSEISAQIQHLAALFDFSPKTKESIASLKETVYRWVGDAGSISRQIFYALLTGLAILLAAGATPGGTVGLFRWLEYWIFLSAFLLIPIHRWTVGASPLTDTKNTLLGDEHSLRRRLLLSLMLAFFFSGLLWGAIKVFMTVLFAESPSASLQGTQPLGDFSLGSFIGWCLISYYLMGFTSGWINLNVDSSILLQNVADKAPVAAGELCGRMKGRGIRDLMTTETDVKQLRRYTAGRISGTQGQQLIFDHGRARIAVFVQDFGKDLFVRWIGFYDMSGRRLWLFIGTFISVLNALFDRWTGTSASELVRRLKMSISPVSRQQVLLDVTQGEELSQLLGLTTHFSEYTLGEISALELAVRDSVTHVLSEVGGDAYEEEWIRQQIDQSRRLEAQTPGLDKPS